MPFTKFGLSEAVLEGVKAMGYVEPTPIQLRAIPLVMSGQDVIGSAQTGTGKTAAFALPILSKLGKHEPQPRVLVLEPTRELAAQVETAFRDFVFGNPVRCWGGTDPDFFKGTVVEKEAAAVLAASAPSRLAEAD